jgi:hypothetical protein
LYCFSKLSLEDESFFPPPPLFSSHPENFGKLFPKLFLLLYLVEFTLAKIRKTFNETSKIYRIKKIETISEDPRIETMIDVI